MSTAELPDPGVVLIDKPTGISSFAALGAVKRVFSTRKVGHTGTLDPFASGLLIALVGQATRTARVFDDLPKSYRAVFAFGSQTDTDDSTGEITHASTLPSLGDMEALLPDFTGTIEQTPPSYSAVHVNGKRAYELARNGVAVEIPSRTVTVHAMRVVAVETSEEGLSTIELDIDCSTGTYIRSLARDLAIRGGVRAHVRTLRRTQIGSFAIADATRPSVLHDTDRLSLAEGIGSTENAALVEIDATMAEAVGHGRPLRTEQLDDRWDSRKWTLLTHDGVAIALGHAEGRKLAYDAVFARRG